MGNPFHLNDQVCREMKYYGCEKYQLSLDGLSEIHDWFRKPGSFNSTIEKIACINRSGIRSVIMTTVSKTNLKEMPGIIDAVVAAGVNVFAFSRYVPAGGDLDISLPPHEYRELLTICDKKFRKYEAEGCQTYFNKKDRLWTLYDYETGAFTIPKNTKEGIIYGGCNCGNCHITILPSGDIYACRRVAKSKVGNVFEDRLADVWVNEMEANRDYDKFKKCRNCELKAWCRGCSAVAKGTNGDFYEADPHCWKKVREFCSFGYDQKYVDLAEECDDKDNNQVNFYYGAPPVLFVCYDKTACWEHPLSGEKSGATDATIVATHMMLEAASINLDTV